jgi:hypothetical protein
MTITSHSKTLQVRASDTVLEPHRCGASRGFLANDPRIGHGNTDERLNTVVSHRLVLAPL